MDEKAEIIEMTADIVSAYVGNNAVNAADIPSLIHNVHRALAGVLTVAETVPAAPKEPAVPVAARSPPTIWFVWKTVASSNRSSVTCAPNTISAPRTTGPSGACRRITPWSRPTTPRRARTWPNRWAWAKAGARAAASSAKPRSSRARLTSLEFRFDPAGRRRVQSGHFHLPGILA